MARYGDAGDYFEATASVRPVSDFGGAWRVHRQTFRSPAEVEAFVRSLDPEGGPLAVKVVATAGPTAARSSVAGVWLCDDSPRRTSRLANQAGQATDLIEWWERADAMRAVQMASAAGVAPMDVAVGAVEAARAALVAAPSLRREVEAALPSPAPRKKPRRSAASGSSRIAALFEGDGARLRLGGDAEAYALYSAKHAALAVELSGEDGARSEREALDAVGLAQKALEASGRRRAEASAAVAEAFHRGTPTIAFLRALAGP